MTQATRKTVYDPEVGDEASRIPVEAPLIERRPLVVDIPPQGISLREIERNVVIQVLSMCRWNKSEAARFLNISRPRLRRIIGDAVPEQNRCKP